MAKELYEVPLYADANLQGYWRFEGNAEDSSSHGIDGTATSITYPSGKFGYGAAFDGDDSVINLGANRFDFSTGTIMFWLCDKGASGGSVTRDIMGRSPQADVWPDFGIAFVGGELKISNNKTVCSYASLTNGDHLAFVFDESTADVYKNGAWMVQVTGVNAINNGTLSNLWGFGDAGCRAYYNFDGVLDDVCIFDRKLTATEISNYYTGLAPIIAQAFAAQAVLSGTPGQYLSAPEFKSECDLSINDTFIGIFAVADPLAAEPELSATLDISLHADGLCNVGGLAVALVTHAIQAAPITGTGILSVSEIYLGSYLSAPPLEALPSLMGNLCIDLYPTELTALVDLTGRLAIDYRIATNELVANGAIATAGIAHFRDNDGPITYECILSGSGGDLLIPMSSFQGRFRSGDPSYLSVVTPGLDLATDINARSTGDLTVYIIKTMGANVIKEAICTVDLEDIVIDEGATSKSITLTGHRTHTQAAKTVTIADVIYANTKNGLSRYRCKPDLYLRPGDTVAVDGNMIAADLISWSVGVGSETMEVSEEGA
jgi:hypothetical protein